MHHTALQHWPQILKHFPVTEKGMRCLRLKIGWKEYKQEQNLNYMMSED